VRLELTFFWFGYIRLREHSVKELRPMAKASVSIEDLDFEQMDDAGLRQAMQRINETLHMRFTSRTQEFRELAREMGFTVTLSKPGKEEVRRSRRDGQENDRRRGVSPKYHNPDNPQETWAGRGLKPKWVKEKLAAGSSLDDLLINREAAQESVEAEENV
jgi:DNA-binding protein H-NS